MDDKNVNTESENSLETPETSVNGVSVEANSADAIHVKAGFADRLSFMNIYLILFAYCYYRWYDHPSAL
jgi:hypothetical protein